MNKLRDTLSVLEEQGCDGTITPEIAQSFFLSFLCNSSTTPYFSSNLNNSPVSTVRAFANFTIVSTKADVRPVSKRLI